MRRFALVVFCMYCIACRSVQSKEVQQNYKSPRRGPTLNAQAAPAEKSAPIPARPPEKISAEKSVAAEPAKVLPVASTRPIQNPYEFRDFMRNVEEEHKKFGTAERAKRYKKRKYGNSVVEQRSGRKRLYDHNIFLRTLFEGRLASPQYGDLGELFKDGIFLDIGSAILYGEGADTVRDLHEDKKINPHLTIIASDVNDPAQKKTMYVDIYRAKGKALPFPVVEVPLLIEKPSHFTSPLKLFLKNSDAGIILRSANAGPDLYYTPKQVQKHLRAAVLAFYERDLIYFFNKYILFKPKKRPDFLIIGEIDDSVGTNHRETTWEEIDWKTRTFDEAVKLNTQHVAYE